jgi:hypothetical protein
MTISVTWKDNGDLIVSCGGDEIALPKETLKKKIEENETLAIKLKPPSGGGSGGGSFPHLSGGGTHVTCDVISPRLKKYLPAKNIFDVRSAIVEASKAKSDYLCFAWNSKEAIPIKEISSLLEAESIAMEIDFWSGFTG